MFCWDLAFSWVVHKKQQINSPSDCYVGSGPTFSLPPVMMGGGTDDLVHTGFWQHGLDRVGWGRWWQGHAVGSSMRGRWSWHANSILTIQSMYPSRGLGVSRVGCCQGVWRQVHGHEAVKLVLSLSRRMPTGAWSHGFPLDGGLARWRATWACWRGHCSTWAYGWPTAHADCTAWWPGGWSHARLRLDTARTVATWVGHHSALPRPVLGWHGAGHAAIRWGRPVHAAVAVHVGGHGAGGGGAGRVHAHVVPRVEAAGAGAHVGARAVGGLGVHGTVVGPTVAIGHVSRHATVHITGAQAGTAGSGGVAWHQSSAQGILVLLHQSLGLPPWSRTAIEIWSQISRFKKDLIRYILQVLSPTTSFTTTRAENTLVLSVFYLLMFCQYLRIIFQGNISKKHNGQSNKNHSRYLLSNYGPNAILRSR